MADVRSARVAGPITPLTGTATVVYTVPSGRTLIVRGLVIANVSGTVDATVQVRVNGTTSGFGLWQGLSILRNETWVAPAYIVLNPGDVLYVRQDTGVNFIKVWLFGSLLDGAPS